jgi:hypothetical protein
MISLMSNVCREIVSVLVYVEMEMVFPSVSVGVMI